MMHLRLLSSRSRWLASAALAITILLCACKNRTGPSRSEVVLLTTTTTQDSGILKALVDAFEARSSYRVKAIVAGSGDVLKQAATGEGDVVLTHSPDAEKEWMKQGYGSSRRLVMYNDFVLVGAPSDPAHVKGSSPAAALEKIVEARATFISRGDQSGTHARELKLWKAAGANPKGQPWYRETGQGQGQTMEVASQQQGYCLTDRGTFLVHQKRLDLAILVEGDPSLFNIYHVITIDPAKFPRVNVAGGGAFADFLLGPEGQQIIRAFGKDTYSVSLFTPAADKKEEDLLGVAGR